MAGSLWIRVERCCQKHCPTVPPCGHDIQADWRKSSAALGSGWEISLSIITQPTLMLNKPPNAFMYGTFQRKASFLAIQSILKKNNSYLSYRCLWSSIYSYVLGYRIQLQSTQATKKQCAVTWEAWLFDEVSITLLKPKRENSGMGSGRRTSCYDKGKDSVRT